MLKKLNTFFKQLYPLGGDFGQKLQQNAAIGLFVALFLIVFQPFGASRWGAPNKTLLLAGFGLVSFLGPTLVHIVLFRWLGKDNLEKNWTVGRETGQYFAMLVLIALGNMLYTNMIGISKMSFPMLLVWVGIVGLVAIFPITAGVLLRYERYIKLNQKEAEVLDKELQHFQREHSPTPAEQLVFASENEKDTLKLSTTELLFIESADNYSNFVWLQNGQIRKQLLRGSMKRFEDQIGNHPYVLRCHRSYIVNLHHVEHASGNAQGYRLTLRHVAMEVPVARNYGPAVLARFRAVSS
jgi:hypothetical protein